MSSGNTPSQHESTLAISPLVTNRGRSQPESRRVSMASSSFRAGTGAGVAGVAAQTPRHPLNNSPLVQKAAHLGTPYVTDGAPTTGLLVSMSKSGLFGPTVPSTLRKVSNMREYSNGSENNGGDDGDNEQFGINISELSAAEKLRLWRHDALMQHHYRTAEYIGDKVYSMTHDPNDAFWLAQVYYNMGQYIRAVQLLSRDGLDASSVMCRYLTALCLVKMEKYDDALDIVGETNPFKDDSAEHVKNQDGGIKLESSLCFLRGEIYSAQNNLEFAKECFKEAVQVDVKNFEAFNHLISNNMLTLEEEKEFISSLDFSDLDDNQELVKCLYATKLSKYGDLTKLRAAQKILVDEYHLDDNKDIQTTEIELLIFQGKYLECLELCENVLEYDEFNFDVLPTYVQCLYELGGKNKLFLVSHKLAESFPKSSITWFAVGTYYFAINNISEARKYFSKASVLDPNFGYAWLGFAHTFAVEGEHEQALSAYSTAARFFPGTHLPHLYLGMQYSRMDTLTLAEAYFMMAYNICPTDPLLLNELGVVYFKKMDYPRAKKFFKRACEAINTQQSDASSVAISTYLNLGHTYRKLDEDERALHCFKTVLERWKPSANVWCALATVYLKMKKLQKAIDALHSVLAMDPNHQTGQQLLKIALDVNVHLPLDNGHPLMVSAKINESRTLGPNDKKRSLGAIDPVVIAKRLKQGSASSDEGDLMDIE
ncbi:HDR190Wp [Eremothecium sinecaudum]|uniref:HDR190Wp n=1 Tax=Eremothecium sinecaudum TaxID=45286 RepID=A0A0X8HSY0_9SACH|nr:HDR190Wp [Eremothecium sinecaudum]AMD20932.1 HDR190Wp [Eremothecium sinecaudum]